MREFIPSLVSTVIPVYNRPELLVEAVQSVLSQTYRPIEIIIVDDGSTDRTREVADQLQQTHTQIVRLISQQNAGPGAARENGRGQARGEFIQYLDSDDRLLPGKFRLQVEGLREHPECGVSYGMARLIDAAGRVVAAPWKGTGTERELMFPSFLASRWWDTPTPLYRASVCEQAGPWSSLRVEEDWEYDTRIAALGIGLHYCPEYVVEIRQRSGDSFPSESSSDPRGLRSRSQAHQQIYRNAQKAGILPEAPEMRQFARELFHLSRQCGAAGLGEESRTLFELARSASGKMRGKGIDFTLYGLLAKTVGWNRAGRVVCRLDGIRG